MQQTEHTVQASPGAGYRVRVNHEDYAAVQYEFYIPEAIWAHTAVETFIKRLQSVEAGATIFRGLVGIWKTAPEATYIYRVIIRGNQVAAGNARSALHGEIGRLLADLSVSPQHAQQTFMFTETDMRVSEANGLTRI